MILVRTILFSICLLSIVGCRQTDAQEIKADPKFANVFKPLDGKWKGIFYIYEWPGAQNKKRNIPKDISTAFVQNLTLNLVDSVIVTQEYQSETPFYQTVSIQDKYLSTDGKWKTITSTGYNQIRGSQLLCVVEKPDETVKHLGSLPQKNTIIWQRNEKKPLKVEYFLETVQDTTYNIVGYGYYGDDNIKKNPKTWFKSRYIRQ